MNFEHKKYEHSQICKFEPDEEILLGNETSDNESDSESKSDSDTKSYHRKKFRKLYPNTKKNFSLNGM